MKATPSGSTSPQNGNGNGNGNSHALARRAPGVLTIHSDRLVPVEQPDRETANGYLRLTAHILLRSQRQVFRTIGVISAREGEGKTTAAVNLAACLGRTRGRAGRVLLVDGDARKRTLTRLLCEDAPEEPLADSELHPMLVNTNFDGVDLMTAPVSPDDLTLHDPSAWVQTLHELGERYAQIVIDCPSVLDNPEGLVLRECAEELVLVVRSGKTTRKNIEEALGNVGGRVLGVILNGGSGTGGEPRS